MPLQLFNLGVGLVNLGVGAYTAYQTHRIRGELDQLHVGMESHFREVHDALFAQAAVLDSLQRGQADLATLMVEIGEGIRRELEADRAREYLEQMALLESAYGSFARAPQIQAEANRLRDATEKVGAYVQGWLRSLPEHDPQRAPWAAAHVLVTRARADALLALADSAHGVDYAKMAGDQLDHVLGDLERWAGAFARDKTIYQLAVSQDTVLPTYAYLMRGLRHGRGDGDLTALPSIDLGPGFRSLVEVGQLLEPVEGTGSNELELRTIRDYTQFLTWSGEDPKTFDISAVRSLARNDIVQAFGVPDQLRLSQASLQGLMDMGGEPAARFEAQLTADLGLPDLTLAKPSPSVGGVRSRPDADPLVIGDSALIEVAVARVAAGDATAARKTANKIGDRYRRAVALAHVAAALAGTGDATGARKDASDARNTAYKIGDQYWRAVALAHVAVALAGTGDATGVRKDATDARNTAETISDPERRAEALAIIVEALAHVAAQLAAAGDATGARENATDARNTAYKIGDQYRRAVALAHVAAALAGTGDAIGARKDATDARNTAETISDPERRSQALATIAEALPTVAEALALAGDAPAARAIAYTISDPERRTETRARITQALAVAGDGLAAHATAETSTGSRSPRQDAAQAR